jgi:hypothetical protein
MELCPTISQQLELTIHGFLVVDTVNYHGNILMQAFFK